MAEDIQTFKALCVLNSSAYEYVHVRIKQGCKMTSQRRHTRMVDAVSVRDRSSKDALSYAKKKDDGKWGGNDRRMAGIESSRLFFVLGRIRIASHKCHEPLGLVYINVRRSTLGED